jgi:hypothetical protein
MHLPELNMTMRKFYVFSFVLSATDVLTETHPQIVNCDQVFV